MGNSLDYQSQFPGEVIGIGDAGIGAKSSGRRCDMRCIAAEKHIVLLETLGHPGCNFPGGDIHDLDRLIWYADSCAYQLDAARTEKLFFSVSPLRVVGSVQAVAATLPASKYERPSSYSWIIHETNGDPPPAKCLPQVSGEKNGELVPLHAGSLHSNAELLANDAAIAIGCNKVTRSYSAFTACYAIPDHCVYPIHIPLK